LTVKAPLSQRTQMSRAVFPYRSDQRLHSVLMTYIEERQTMKLARFAWTIFTSCNSYDRSVAQW